MVMLVLDDAPASKSCPVSEPKVPPSDVVAGIMGQWRKKHSESARKKLPAISACVNAIQALPLGLAPQPHSLTCFFLFLFFSCRNAKPTMNTHVQTCPVMARYRFYPIPVLQKCHGHLVEKTCSWEPETARKVVRQGGKDSLPPHRLRCKDGR